MRDRERERAETGRVKGALTTARELQFELQLETEREGEIDRDWERVKRKGRRKTRERSAMKVLLPWLRSSVRAISVYLNRGRSPI